LTRSGSWPPPPRRGSTPGTPPGTGVNSERAESGPSGVRTGTVAGRDPAGRDVGGRGGLAGGGVDGAGAASAAPRA
jgi:hypothetical protein